GEPPLPITVAPAKAGAASGLNQRCPRKPTAAPAFAGATASFGRNPSELISQPRAEKPLVGAAGVGHDRRSGEARGDAAILRAADQRQSLSKVARQRIGARDAKRIFARGRLAPRAVIDGQPARGTVFGID